MSSDAQQIAVRVQLAKKDSHEADALIADYMPFIKSETAKFLKRSPEQTDDELSIAMFAFYEAIRNYSRLRGSFLKLAALQIRNRLIDHYRREKRNTGNISLDAGDEEHTGLLDTISDEHNDYEENELRNATRHEIEELSAQMKDFGLSMSDIAESSPKQNRSIASCSAAIRFARCNPELLDEFLASKRVPLAKLAKGASVDRKSLERHRDYLAGVLLICTNGYEILRGHIMQVLSRTNSVNISGREDT